MKTLRSLCPAPPDWRLDWPAVDDVLPCVSDLRGCRQDAEHHAEGDVWVHTRMVCEALVAGEEWRGLDAEERLELFAAALLHDIGKPARTRVEDGRIRSPGHSVLGARMARRILWEMGAPLGWRERVCSLVRYHQAPFFLVDQADAERRAITMSMLLRCDRLGMLARADASGRVSASRDRILDQVELFEEFCREVGVLERPFPFASDHSRFLYFRRADRDPRYAAYDDTTFTVTLLSGLPASGKDHWAARSGLPSVSLDELRAELGIPAKAMQGRVVSAARERAQQFLRRQEPFVWNATNLNRDRRAHLISMFAGYGARVEIVYLEASPEALQARNAARGRPVPAAAVERMLRTWDVPDLTEAHAVTRLATDS